MPNRAFRGNIEPTIEDLLTDPIAQLLRKRDGIEIDEVLATVEQAREALRHRRLTRGDVAEAAA